MNLEIYVDETGTSDPSGKQDGSEVAGVAGFVSSPDEWAALSVEWNELLGKHGVHYFHFSEFADKKNRSSDPQWPYYNWTNERKDDLLYGLAAITRKRTQFGRGGFVRVREYERIMPSWFKKEVVTNPYDLCFQRFLQAMLTEIKSRCLGKVEPTKANFFFDHSTNPEWIASVEGMFAGVKKQRDTLGHMGELGFAEMRDSPPIQAADLLAYRMRQILTNEFEKNRKQPESQLDKILGPNNQMQMYDAECFEDLARDLETFKEEYERSRTPSHV